MNDARKCAAVPNFECLCTYRTICGQQSRLQNEKSCLDVLPLAVDRTRIRENTCSSAMCAVMLQVTYLMHKPMLPFLNSLDRPQPSNGPSDAHQDSIFATFAANAAHDPSKASGLRVTVHKGTDLVLNRSDPSSSRLYVQYEFPGYPQPVNSALKAGRHPEFADSRVFEFGPHPQSAAAFLNALRTALVTFAVFDAAGAGDDALVGRGDVSLQCALCLTLWHFKWDCSLACVPF
jgi:hypothetical protein